MPLLRRYGGYQGPALRKGGGAFGGNPDLGLGIQAYWNFNGASTTFGSNDPSYYGYDSVASYDLAKVGGNPLADATGKILRGVQANGLGPEFSYTTTDFRQSGDFSVSFWLRVSATGSTGPLIVAEVAGTIDWSIRLTNAGNVQAFYFDNVGGSISPDSGTASTVAFQHHAVVYTAADRTVRLYKAGVLAGGPSSLAAPLRQTSTTLRVAVAGDAVWRMDEVGVWRRALSATDVGNLNTGIGY
jgi:hypothetical protein